MIDQAKLLRDLKPQLQKLEDDLRSRSEADAAISQRLNAQWSAARANERTSDAYPVWRDELITQIAVAWVLGCVFVRFLEDNELIDHPWLSGAGNRLDEAGQQHQEYFRVNRLHSDRDYLEDVFRKVEALPGLGHIFDEKHNPLWQFGPTGDGATRLLRFWQERNPDTGDLKHDFQDGTGDTRFLGDLYQDLSAAARKKFALLQTPEFVEEFILDRTLDPAIELFGLKGIRMIDPTCGSGHFVLGGFHRVLARWQREEPATPIRELIQRSLDSVYGVDLNPAAVAIARFRLLMAALKAAGITKLREAPNFRMNLATGDSLLHGIRQGLEFEGLRQMEIHGEGALRPQFTHFYETEDAEDVRRILNQTYHAVVGNPPYITVKDRAVSELYRARFPSCHRQYSLSVPFMERFFDLAVKGDGTPQQPAGFVGQITANSFMKREFGKKLIEEYLPRWDLTHVLDTSGAYIPGPGTPTVILFGKNQPPVNDTIRTVLGIRGEPATPAELTLGLVWHAILKQIDQPGSESEWVSAADSPRDNFHQHPWSIGGGGAAGLKEIIDEAAACTIESESEWPIGRAVRIGEEEAFIFDAARLRHSKVDEAEFRGYLIGENVREWSSSFDTWVWYPYCQASGGSDMIRQLWLWRTTLGNRATFQGKMHEAGLDWFGYQQHTASAYSRPLSISFGEVATHNHFVLDRGGKVFKQTAPIIKLKPDATEEAHLQLLGVLNSSTACFWLRQVCFPKGGDHQGTKGARVRTTLWDERFAFNATQIANLPIPARQPSQLPTALVQTSTALQGQSPAATLAGWGGPESGDLRARLATARDQATRLRRQLIAWQEELDWQIYEAFGLVEGAAEIGPAAVSLPEGAAVDAIPPEGIELGQRAFEIVLARRMAAGEAQSTWFKRHGSTPITEVPPHWPAAYRELVERRIRRIADDPNIRLIEQPEYKRRWNTEPWDEQLAKALREWLLNRVEETVGVKLDQPAGEGAEAANQDRGREELLTTQEITDLVMNPDFRKVAEIYRGRPDFDPHTLVAELVASAAVPFLPGQRYKESGLRKRAVWEDTWEKQRQEDRIDEELGVSSPGVRPEERPALDAKARKLKAEHIGDIPVPPKYKSEDFRSAGYWSLRGKLDVPKERFISYPGCSPEGNPCLTVAWAGLNHLQQARALAAHYAKLEQTGSSEQKMVLVLAGLNEIIPWLKQWHNELDPEFAERMGDHFENYVREEAKRWGKSLPDLKTLAQATV